MGATTYRLELDANRHPTLVKESEFSCYDKPITEPAYIVELCDKLVRLRFLAEENVIMVAVDTKGYILGIFKVSQGTIDMATCTPRKIFIRALLVGASRIFLVHNHPSGDCTPSKVDIECKERIEEIGNMIGINLNDFIIVGMDSFENRNHLAAMHIAQANPV